MYVHEEMVAHASSSHDFFYYPPPHPHPHTHLPQHSTHFMLNHFSKQCHFSTVWRRLYIGHVRLIKFQPAVSYNYPKGVSVQ